MNKYYLSRNYNGFGSAGNKAKSDIEVILTNLGYKNAGIKQTTHLGKIMAFVSTLRGAVKTPFCIKKGGVLVLQYPLRKYYNFLCNMAHLRGCKVITIIHDLGSFRRKRLTEGQEIKRLNHSDYIIAHNESMKQWLLQHNSTSQIGCLQIFDYLSPSETNNKEIPELPYTVIYAGSLPYRKNAFLYMLGEHIHSYNFDIYGGQFEEDAAPKQSNYTYKGYIPTDEFITTVKGHFGLVWDGDSVSSCTGNAGEYLLYNNPHKTSFYIRCLLPIIIWEKAAMAPFIRENGLGLCVNSLENLDSILASLTREEYEVMKSNVAKMSEQLASGLYMERALNEACEYITKL